MEKKTRILSLISITIVSCFSLSTGTSAAAHTPKSAELESLGSASGERSEATDLVAEVNEAKRNQEGDALSVTWSVENNGDSDTVLTWLYEGSYTYSGSYFSGVTASSPETGTKYHPFMDGVGECLCSGNTATDFIQILYPGDKITYWSLYPMSGQAETVTVEIPGFEPIEDVPIS